MKLRIGLPILAIAITNAQAAVIGTNTFSDITGNTTTTATSSWTDGPAIGTATLGTIFTGTSAFRVVNSVDLGANLSYGANVSTSTTTDSLTFTLATGASSLELGQISFQYYSTTGAANQQATYTVTGIFSLTITGGPSPINAGPINVIDIVGATGNNGNPYTVGTFNLGTILAANTTYTFTLGLDANVGYVTLDNLTLETVPEPSVALLGGLGVLGLLRRRR